MRRMDGSENFTRQWEDYKAGFGSLSGEFYAGTQPSNHCKHDRSIIIT